MHLPPRNLIWLEIALGLVVGINLSHGGGSEVPKVCWNRSNVVNKAKLYDKGMLQLGVGAYKTQVFFFHMKISLA